MTASGVKLETRVLVAGPARGPLLALEQPLSFWGGIDPETGVIIDSHHPQLGTTVTGTVLKMPAGKGSSSSSSVLAEAIRLGTAPAALVLQEPDVIVVLGALVATELYGTTCPIVVLEGGAYDELAGPARVDIAEDGTLVAEPQPPVHPKR
jgi:predicted aconitase with swiveling domain